MVPKLIPYLLIETKTEPIQYFLKLLLHKSNIFIHLHLKLSNNNYESLSN
jgi:hypothetical protein